MNFYRTYSKLTGQLHLNLSFDHIKPTLTQQPPMNVPQNITCLVLFHPKDAFVLACSRVVLDSELTIYLPTVRSPKEVIEPNCQSSNESIIVCSENSNNNQQ